MGILRKKELENEFLKLNEDYQKLLKENIKLKEDFEIYNQQQKIQAKKIETAEKAEKNAKKLKHDMRNHLMVIAMYLTEKKYDEAKVYTSKMLDKLNLSYSYVESGNAILNYILNIKINEAREKGIDIKLQIENILFSNIENFDFSTMLGNCLDNALESAQKSQNKTLSLVIKEKGGYNSILVSNSIDGSILEENNLLKTTKEDYANHGIGLNQIKEIVSKYNGFIDIYEENLMFCVNILIPKN